MSGGGGKGAAGCLMRCEQFGYSGKHAIKLLRAKLPLASGRPKPGPRRAKTHTL